MILNLSIGMVGYMGNSSLVYSFLDQDFVTTILEVDVSLIKSVLVGKLLISFAETS